MTAFMISSKIPDFSLLPYKVVFDILEEASGYAFRQLQKR